MCVCVVRVCVCLYVGFVCLCVACVCLSGCLCVDVILELIADINVDVKLTMMWLSTCRQKSQLGHISRLQKYRH